MLARIFLVIGGIAVGGFLLDILLDPSALLPRNERMGEWRQATVRSACYRAVDDLAAAGLPQFPSDARHIDFGDFARLVQMTAALDCYLVANRDAICDPNNRAWIVEYTGNYFSKLQGLIAAAERHGEAEARLLRRALDSDKSQAIAAALESNIRDGRMARADFGWFTPRSLKPVFEKYGSRRDTCPTQTAASGR